MKTVVLTPHGEAVRDEVRRRAGTPPPEIAALSEEDAERAPARSCSGALVGAARPLRARAAPGPTYFAVGRISRASRFCSRMCAAQPAVRAQVNMLVNIDERDVGVVEHDRRPELDVGGEHAVGLARLQLGERGLLERLGDLEALASRSRARCGAGRAARGSSAR